MRRVRFRHEVDPDLSEARTFYEERRLGLGDELLAAVQLLVARIARAPLEFPVVHRGIRRALIKRFPYAIFFRASDTEILVLAILRQSARPRRWRSRG